MTAFAWFALGYVAGMFATVFLFVTILSVLREREWARCRVQLNRLHAD